jgi:hypothetical protein
MLYQNIDFVLYRFLQIGLKYETQPNRSYFVLIRKSILTQGCRLPTTVSVTSPQPLVTGLELLKQR